MSYKKADMGTPIEYPLPLSTSQHPYLRLSLPEQNKILSILASLIPSQRLKTRPYLLSSELTTISQIKPHIYIFNRILPVGVISEQYKMSQIRLTNGQLLPY